MINKPHPAFAFTVGLHELARESDLSGPEIVGILKHYTEVLAECVRAEYGDEAAKSEQ
jgi:hypothetical protein